ncbi:hypothetical protein F4821DRAFT_235953 [Hypoxylon rubiginosum]|uniref:Uncharacterized protein n=1 Tax=Hypoxylon rubiginosum TaxID=110542 RepID=A0ACC0D4D4_9PEZI|nr:hypothetical protein F4821DRAFT_235953 [Hypoxylon rubiginosum]
MLGGSEIVRFFSLRRLDQQLHQVADATQEPIPNTLTLSFDMDSLALATGALFGAARQMNTMLFGANSSAVTDAIEILIPVLGLENMTILYPTTNTPSVVTDSVVGAPITNVIIDMTTTSNKTSQRMVDSGVEIDTVVTVASIRPQVITQHIESQMTDATAAVGHSSASQAAATDAPDTTSTEQHA